MLPSAATSTATSGELANVDDPSFGAKYEAPSPTVFEDGLLCCYLIQIAGCTWT